jgi:hypothetical protein
MATLALGGCGETGKEVENRHRREHPCEFSATSKECHQEERKQKLQEEARHETGVLRQRARVEAERARLKEESKR